ncbi:hypothetical protein [Streptomyces sp. G-G2]|uniref:hypothetical protein n=1 Tax=Streptomyces sp. G-G2 TaxID=3046201 RepID=UPI0024BA4F3B|nr:hypothetical protein [Streptomyces sp. G-G2]MDJ0385802.1 hypothetical protein [Streptomyces sp. G-G2]
MDFGPHAGGSRRPLQEGSGLVRVYGTDHDDPHPCPCPGRDYADLVGGPLDGPLLDITGWTVDAIQTGVALMTELGQFGVGGRALYDPGLGERHRWDGSGDTP